MTEYFGSQYDDTIIIGGASGGVIYGGSSKGRKLAKKTFDDKLAANYDNFAYAGEGNDKVYGNSQDDAVDGGNGDDLIYGGKGSDLLVGGNGKDTVYGGSGDDMIGASATTGSTSDNGSDKLIGDGLDTVDGQGQDTALDSFGNDSIFGGNAKDEIWGDAEGDDGSADGGSDILFGNNGDDSIHGGGGDDEIEGENGADQLWGGKGSDVFGYSSVAESNAAAFDTIWDFDGLNGGSADHDRLDFSEIEAALGIDFTWLGKSAGNLAGGQAGLFGAWYSWFGDGTADPTDDFTFVYADTDKDGDADVVVRLKGLHDIAAADLDGVNKAPEIASDGGGATAAVSIDENTKAVTNVDATDPDPGTTLKYTLAGGDDQSLFTIDDSTGVLSFVAAPNFEAPGDKDGNNTYVVVVQVSDGALTDTQTLTVTVNDVNDAPVITSDGGGATASIAVNENSTVVTTVTATDEDKLPAPDTLKFSLAGGADAALFKIDEASGVLSFIASPNFEAPGDADTNNKYEVKVQVSDGSGGTDVQTVTVTVNDVNDAPVVTSDGGGTTASASVNENSTVVTTVTATDEDKLPTPDTLKFTLAGGADATLFKIDEASGVLSFITAPNFEAPADADTDNKYEVKVQVSDGNGGTDVQTLTVTVEDVNDAPVITSDGGGVTGSISINENATVVTTVTATDEDKLPAPDILKFSLAGGADAALFKIDETSGALSFIAAPNFEAPGDADTDNKYEVKVQVSDGNGGIDVQALTVTVEDVNEAPVITSNGGGATASVSIDENTKAVTDVDATDEDLPPQALKYSLVGGVDKALFTIDESSGALSFIAAPNFEGPVGGDNSYEVVVQVSDGALVDTQTLIVTVNDVNDAPVISSNGGGAAASVEIDENTTAVTLVTATDEDKLPAPDILKFALAGGADAALFTIDEASGALSFIATPNFEAPVGGDNSYEVVVQVSDGTLIDTQTLTVTIKDANEAPVITSNGGGATASVSIDENSKAVTTVTATDEDTLPAPDTLKYSLAGGADKALFSIDETSGALSFIAAPNFEAPVAGDNSYEVQVQVSDGAGGIDTQTLTVTVNDVNDAPVITSNGGGATASVSIDENTKAVTTVTASDEDTLPAPDTLKFSLVGGADKALFTIDETSGALSFISAPNFEAPVGGDNSYDVIVQVSDGVGGIDTQTLTVTVKDVEENAPPVIGALSASTISEVAQKSTVVGKVAASDDEPGHTFSLIDNAGGRFSIDAASGVISLADSSLLDFESFTSHSVEVKVTDSDGAFATKTFTINVTDVASVSSFTGSGGTTDTVDGTSGNDALNGDNGDDLLYGGKGDDTLNGGTNADRLFGQDGNDTLIGDNAADFVLHGGAGTDNLSGGAGSDLLIGGTGADTMDGGGAADNYRFLKGDLGSGVDTINGFEITGDKLQIGDLLVGFGPGSTLTDFVKATSTDGNTTISIDADGAAGSAVFVDLVVLQGVGAVILANVIDTSAQGTV